MKTKISLLVLLVAAVFTTTSCQRLAAKLPYDRQLPPGALALRKITNPDKIPDFTAGCYNMAGMRTAIDNSLNYLGKPSSKQFFPYGDISHQRAVDSLKAFGDLVDSGLRGRPLNDAIVQKFDVYISVGCDDMGTVLFTGYYTPIFYGSQSPTEQFKYPLYKQPDDLVKDSFGEILGRR
ncbi:MAG TPA: MltA domain-containing protein, partial [Sedimentisphaerales bacterium]|nr:MltA domain-containing protein [Sedimentisphaerales bacterium]